MKDCENLFGSFAVHPYLCSIKQPKEVDKNNKKKTANLFGSLKNSAYLCSIKQRYDMKKMGYNVSAMLLLLAFSTAAAAQNNKEGDPAQYREFAAAKAVNFDLPKSTKYAVIGAAPDPAGVVAYVLYLDGVFFTSVPVTAAIYEGGYLELTTRDGGYIYFWALMPPK